MGRCAIQIVMVSSSVLSNCVGNVAFHGCLTAHLLCRCFLHILRAPPVAASRPTVKPYNNTPKLVVGPFTWPIWILPRSILAIL
jgi:hypothetical protein